MDRVACVRCGWYRIGWLCDILILVLGAFAVYNQDSKCTRYRVRLVRLVLVPDALVPVGV